MEYNHQKDSDSNFDSSNSSKSMATAVSEDTLKLGTESIWALLWHRGYPQFLQYFYMAVNQVFEIRLVSLFLGYERVLQLLPMLVLRNIFALLLGEALASGACVYIDRNLALNQVLIANTYYAHFFVVAIAAWLISIVLFFAVFNQLVKFQGNYYLLIHMCVSPLLNMFGFAPNVFLRSESRIFAVFVKDLFVELVFLALCGILYLDQRFFKDELTIPALISASSYCVAFGFGVFVMFRIPFYDIKYRGTLNFLFKRLSPLRPKFMLNIVLSALPQFMITSYDQFLILMACLFLHFKVKQLPFQILQTFRMAGFYLIRELTETFNRTMRDTFTTLAGFNVGIKKVTRVFECLWKSLLVSAAGAVVVPSIMLIISSHILQSLMPEIQEKKVDKYLSYEFIVRESKSALMAGAWGQYLKSFFFIAMQMMGIEGNFAIASYIQLCMLLITLLYVWQLYEVEGDNAPLYLPIALCDICNGIIGVIMLSYHLYKYQYLSFLNKQSTKKQADIAVAGDDTNQAVRQSVINDIDNKVTLDEEQINMDTKKTRINQIFNKTVALNTSKVFSNFRDSMVYGKSRNGSTMQRNSLMPNPETLRESGSVFHKKSELNASVERNTQNKDSMTEKEEKVMED